MIDQIASTANALSRTQPRRRRTSSTPPSPPRRPAPRPRDFSSMITQMIAQTAEALHRAEATSVAGIHGQASVQNVVESVIGAEQTLAGRDRDPGQDDRGLSRTQPDEYLRIAS